MKIVIQCAARKQPDAGSFTGPDGRPVLFVARPDLAPPVGTHSYARPDDLSSDGRSWRTRLLAYNERPNANALGLLRAGDLYAHNAYRRLIEKFGLASVFILSAGWGLIPASFLTPAYDITFTASADEWKRRRQDDGYEDFCLIPDDRQDVLFLGGKDYVPLFCRLTAAFSARKVVFFNAARPPRLPFGFDAVRYATTTRTNWHYACAHDLVAELVEGF